MSTIAPADIELRPERCPTCDYVLAGLPDPVRCPECGLEIGDDLVLHVWNWELSRVSQMGRRERRSWVVLLILITLILWLFMGRGSLVLLPLFLVALAATVGELLARGAKPKYRLWLSRRGFTMWFGMSPGKLEPWPTGLHVTFQNAAAGLVTIRVLIEGCNRLMLPVMTVRMAEAQRAEAERRVEAWLLDINEAKGN